MKIEDVLKYAAKDQKLLIRAYVIQRKKVKVDKTLLQRHQILLLELTLAPLLAIGSSLKQLKIAKSKKKNFF